MSAVIEDKKNAIDSQQPDYQSLQKSFQDRTESFENLKKDLVGITIQIHVG